MNYWISIINLYYIYNVICLSKTTIYNSITESKNLIKEISYTLIENFILTYEIYNVAYAMSYSHNSLNSIEHIRDSSTVYNF